ncbi:MAG: hypothetical protein GY719_39280 [bacterium]|nr:hypothetical protein [bacterium]
MRAPGRLFWAVGCALAISAAGCRHLDFDPRRASVSPSIRAMYDDVFCWVEAYDDIAKEVPAVTVVSGERRAWHGGASGPEAAGSAEGGDDVLSFVHLSDAQIRDERVKLIDRRVSRWFDKFAPVTEYGEEQERFDTAALLALVHGLNRHLDPKENPDARKPLFAVHTGDAVHVGVFHELYEFLTVTQRLDLPWLQVIGNHDITAFGTELFDVLVSNPRQTVFPFYNGNQFMHLHGDAFREDAGLGDAFPGDEPPGDAGSTSEEPEGKGLLFGGVRVSPVRTTPHERTEDCLDKPYHGFDLDGNRAYYALVSPSEEEIASEELRLCQETWWPARLEKGFAVRFLFLDTTDVQDPNVLSPPPQLHRGGVHPDSWQMAWLREQLSEAAEAGQHVVAYGHHDLAGTNLRGKDEKGSFRTGRDEVIALFAAQPRFLGYFSGHTHKQELRLVHGSGTPFWEVIGPPLVEWPQAGLFVDLVRLPGDELAWDLTPFHHGYQDPGRGAALDPEAADPVARLRAQTLRRSRSAYDDYHRGKPEDEPQPPARLVIPTRELRP